MFAKRRGSLALCNCPHCLITAHATPQEGTKISSIPYFKGMSCFQIAHSIEAQDLFTIIERKGYKHLRAKPKHFIWDDLKEQYEKDQPRQLQLQEPASPRRRGRPAKTHDEANELSSVSSNSTVTAQVVTSPKQNKRITRSQTDKKVTRKIVQRPNERAIREVTQRTRCSRRLRNKIIRKI